LGGRNRGLVLATGGEDGGGALVQANGEKRRFTKPGEFDLGVEGRRWVT